MREKIDFLSRVSLLKGVGSHLQCPGCNKLIQDPRMLACSHTYCKSCLDKATKKTVDVSSVPSIVPLPASAGVGPPSSLEPYMLNYDLRRILGSSLNKELETSLNKILDGGIGNTEPGIEKATAVKFPESKSHKKKSGQKGKGTAKAAATNGGTPTGPQTISPLDSSPGAKATSKSSGKNSTIEVLVCPNCGMHTEIPGGNISLIPYNFFMQHIMDLMTYYSSEDPVPLVYCSMCRKDGVLDLPAAVARCSTCASFLCKQCYQLHSIDDFTKLHSTLSITERGDSSIFSCLTPDDTKVRNCITHSGKPFVYFCIKCSKGICELCSWEEHKSHLFSEPENLHAPYVKYIHDLMSRTTQLQRRTESAVRTTQDLMSGIQLLAATQIEEVLRTRSVLSSALDTRLSVLLREADEISGKKLGNKR